jgi:hypothetical protein
MSGVDAAQHGLALTLELLHRIHNGKLSLLLRASGIEFCEGINKIIQRAPEIVTGFACKRAKSNPQRRFQVAILRLSHDAADSDRG